MRRRSVVVTAVLVVVAGAGVGLGEDLSGPSPHPAGQHPASGAAAYRHAATAGGPVVPSTTATTPALTASGRSSATGSTTTTTTITTTTTTTTTAARSAGSGSAGGTFPAETGPSAVSAAPSTTSPATTSQPAPVSGGVCGSGRGACAADTVTVGPTAASGGAVPLTATVRPASAAAGGPTPSGYVMFSIDTGHGLQPAPCSQAPSGPRQGVVSLDSHGTATCTVTLASGTYRIGALYVSSTGAYRGGASAPATVRVS